MELIDAFHRMEMDEQLFNIGKDIGIPIWDIMRYKVYIKYYYPEKERVVLFANSKIPYADYIKIISNVIRFMYRILFIKGENIVLTHSKFYNSSRKLFDKNALSIIRELSDNCLILEEHIGKNYEFDCLYDAKFFFRKIRNSVNLPNKYYVKIEEALVKHLKNNIFSYSEANKIYNDFISDYKYYNVIFKKKHTKKLFIATGNPKAVLLAANNNHVKTFLLQHASILFDYVEYSYPQQILNDSNILFADIFLVYGEYWGKNINIPVKKKLTIGSNISCGNKNIISDNSILVVSTIIHGGELKALTRELSTLNPEIKIVYKLHSNEYMLYNEYISYFSTSKNVLVLTDQVEVNKLIALSQLVILIISSVLYEALNQNKKVGVYKKLNFDSSFNSNFKNNVYYFDSAHEILEILKKSVIANETNFYDPINYSVIKKICSNNFL